MTGVVFSLFFRRAKASAKQARGAGRVFPSRACLTLLARFALAFVRLKNAKTITPVLICSFNNYYNRTLACVIKWRRLKLGKDFTRVLSKFRETRSSDDVTFSTWTPVWH